MNVIEALDAAERRGRAFATAEQVVAAAAALVEEWMANGVGLRSEETGQLAHAVRVYRDAVAS